MVYLIFIVVTYILVSITLVPIFKKAGVDGNKALIPGVNFVEWARLIGKPSWWPLLLLIPIVNIFIIVGMSIDLVRSFGKFTFLDSVIAAIFPPAIFYKIGSDNSKYLGQSALLEKEYKDKINEAIRKKDLGTLRKLESTNPYQKTAVREWTESIIFAVFAAAFIRMFLIEAYVIPTSSMEGSLLVGDFLFVSKAHYGIRTPMTVLQIPLLHNRLPGGKAESYISKPSLPYFRLPAIQKIKHNDPVVFNYPEGDSVYFNPERTYSVYDIRRAGPEAELAYKNQPLIVRPIDKKDHYIKRCIGLPGDTVKIVDRQVYINGQPAKNPTKIEYRYLAQSNTPINMNKLIEWGVNPKDCSPGENLYTLPVDVAEKVKALSPDIKLQILPGQNRNLFPHDMSITETWTIDNYGPIYVPAKGATISISPKNIAFYRRIISVYEGNEYQEKDGKIYINGKEATSYTFKQDYFWMMGDNRHNSEDSRIWGFVPEDHIVGKPLFIWFSTKQGNMFNGINWNRIFTGATKM